MLLGKGIMSIIAERGGIIALYDTKKKDREVLALKINKGDNIDYNATMNILKPILKDMDIYKLINSMRSMQPHRFNDHDQCDIYTIVFNGARMSIIIDGNKPTKASDINLSALLCYGDTGEYYLSNIKGVGRNSYVEFRSSVSVSKVDLLKVINELTCRFYGYLSKINSTVLNPDNKVTYLNTPVVDNGNVDRSSEEMKQDIKEILKLSEILTTKIDRFKLKYGRMLEI